MLRTGTDPKTPMDSTVARYAAGVLALLASAAVAAHHSFSAEFDVDEPVNLTGLVTKVEWFNPHVWFYVDVEDDAGNIENWAFELGSPNGLMRAGWTKNTLKLGERVTVEGSRARDGTNAASARTVILAATGQRLFSGSADGDRP